MAALVSLALLACGIPFAMAQTNTADTTTPDTSIPATCVPGQHAWVGKIEVPSEAAY